MPKEPLKRHEVRGLTLFLKVFGVLGRKDGQLTKTFVFDFCGVDRHTGDRMLKDNSSDTEEEDEEEWEDEEEDEDEEECVAGSSNPETPLPTNKSRMATETRDKKRKRGKEVGHQRRKRTKMEQVRPGIETRRDGPSEEQRAKLAEVVRSAVERFQSLDVQEGDKGRPNVPCQSRGA